ncbi:uncharacterized protein TNCV_2177031 [Trichonephila clavipes]|uniref:Mutator-like transposase domain-containing protein n=1 Tax=Trichonephila clavipes TaxID=2585209 RepID=A0A8X7B908_TRICX|nr:uncharacterized protein TNCV_2177031 [Trichonephila clavipes]
MPRLQKVFKKRKGKYYPRKNTINSKVSTTDIKLNAQAEHAHDSKQSCAKEKKVPNLNESFSSFGDSVGKSGLAITFVLKCFACPHRVEFSSSNFHEGTQLATLNTRFVYAMRSIGKGAEAGKMFCGVMNLPQPPTRFSPYGKRILNAAKLVYEDSIQNDAKEAICENEGDGDCKAFDAVKKKNIYGNEYPIEKLECIGHVMKRMGTRLRRLKAQLKGQILSDGKCVSEKNRLTEHEIDNLQSYYGSAIRRNHSSVQNMRQAIWVIFLHKLSTDEYPQHGFCPIGEDSWCRFKKAEDQKLKILQKMGVEPGEFSVSAMKLLDRERLMKAIYAFSGRSKKIRKDKRRKRKEEEDNIKKISYHADLELNAVEKANEKEIEKLQDFSPLTNRIFVCGEGTRLTSKIAIDVKGPINVENLIGQN